MNFQILRANPMDTVKLEINNKSCAFFMDENGLSLNGTISPQPGVDYIINRRASYDIDRYYLQIIGVDML